MVEVFVIDFHRKGRKNMQHYLKTVEETLSEVKATANGLSSKEAEERLQRDGKNKLKEPPKDSLLKKFLLQFADPMIIILVVAAVISGVTAFYAHESFADVIIILAVVLINAVAPLLYACGVSTGNEAMTDRALALLESLRPEKNSIVRRFASMGVGVNSALESQAVIQLNNEYCQAHKCLYCRIGHKLLARSAMKP